MDVAGFHQELYKSELQSEPDVAQTFFRGLPQISDKENSECVRESDKAVECWECCTLLPSYTYHLHKLPSLLSAVCFPGNQNLF